MNQITVPELLQMIGEQQVQIALLHREIARLQPPAAAGPGDSVPQSKVVAMRGNPGEPA